MDCKEFRERLDAYADGELSADSAAEAREHSKGCESCSKAEALLRRLRGSMKRVVKQHRPPPELEAEVLLSLRARGRRTHSPGGEMFDANRGERAPVWRARVSVPLPLFGLLLLAVVALVVWLGFARGGVREDVSANRPLPSASTVSAEEASGSFDFSRYYNGGRASVQVVRRASLDGAGR